MVKIVSGSASWNSSVIAKAFGDSSMVSRMTGELDQGMIVEVIHAIGGRLSACSLRLRRRVQVRKMPSILLQWQMLLTATASFQQYSIFVAAQTRANQRIFTSHASRRCRP